MKQKMFKTMIRETRRLLGSNKKCSKQGEFKLSCEFCAEGSSEGSLISEMSSEFEWSSIFWEFKLSRVSSVYKFPNLSPQL